MTGFRAVAAVLLCLAAPGLAACTKSSEGTPVADRAGTATNGPGSTAAPTESPDPGSPTTGFEHPDFGVVPTSTAPIPAGTVTCEPEQRPPVGMVAQVADSVAPMITVAVPEGWSMQGGSGDVGAQLNGPDGMSATVSIVPTTLDPQQAFAEYADDLTEDAAVSSLSVLAAELCDYSGQKLLGAVSDTPEEAIEFVDRVVHVWTNSRSYLVSVHTQAPTGTAGFDSAATQLTEDFEVKIP
jgi:hypothetical protein